MKTMKTIDRILGEATTPRKTEWFRIGPYSMNAYLAYMYAIGLKERVPEAEEAIAHSEYKDLYLEAFPEAKDEWRMNGWFEGEWL